MSIQWYRRTYNESQFIEAWSSSQTIAECARKLNLCGKGSGYSNLKSTALELGLDSKHMNGSGWRRGKEFPSTRKTVTSHLVKSNKALPSHVKKKLFDEGILIKECSAPYCSTPKDFIDPFTGEASEIPLAIDHENGDNTDHRIENLRVLCYNCHGKTETWCRGNSRKKYIQNFCSCGASITKNASKCRACVPRNTTQGKTKIQWPDDIKLLEMINKSNIHQVSMELNISDTAVRKHLRNAGYDPKTLSQFRRNPT